MRVLPHLTTTLRAEGDARPEVAWERYAELARWPQWSPQITGVEAGGPRLVAGLTGTVRGPAGVRIAFTVLEVDEAARTWSWRASLGPVVLVLHHGVEARAGGCATWLRTRGLPPVVLAYAPLARLALGRLVAA